jgi:hypothetical protein
LIQIARDPDSRVREIAQSAGITERAAHAILRDLREAGIVHAHREGRQNVNHIDIDALARHRPWGSSEMEIPPALREATIRGLEALVGRTHEPNGHRLQPRGADATRRWGFLTTHALALIFVTQHPRSTVREIAASIGVTERAAHSVLQDLRESGIIDREREGRRNRHTVNFERAASFRREGTAPDLVPPGFVAFLMDALAGAAGRSRLAPSA